MSVMGSKSQIIPLRVTAALDARDKLGQAKSRKMWRRWINRGWTLKGNAAKRWAWIKDVSPV